METEKTISRILKLIFKDFAARHTVTTISKELGMSRWGVWKVLRKLESEKILILSPVGSGKTSTYIISLNWENPIVERMLAIILTEETLKNQRWASSFSEFEGKAKFSIIYGGILNKPKEANDIDIVSVISTRKNFIDMEKITANLQKTQLKKIHSLNFTEAEFKSELKKPNRAFIDAVKKGVVLFGQDSFIRFIKGLAT